MSWVDKAHRKNNIQKQIDAEMRDSKYQLAEKKKIQEATREAFDSFLLISADYLHRYCGYGKKRMLKFIDFVVDQMHCVEEEPEYFRLPNKELADETGVDILNNVVRHGGK